MKIAEKILNSMHTVLSLNDLALTLEHESYAEIGTDNDTTYVFTDGSKLVVNRNDWS